MAYYGRFDTDGVVVELLRNPTPVPGDAVLLTRFELFTLLGPLAALLTRTGVDEFTWVDIPDGWGGVPTSEALPPGLDPGGRQKTHDALRLLRVTDPIVREFIEQRVAMQLGSAEITSTRLPTAYGLRIIEFRQKLRDVLATRIRPSDTIPTPPDD